VQGCTDTCLKNCVLFNPQVKFWLDNESQGKKWHTVLSAKQLTPGTRPTKTSQHRRTKENFRKGIVWILGTCAYSICLAFNLCLLLFNRLFSLQLENLYISFTVCYSGEGWGEIYDLQEFCM